MSDETKSIMRDDLRDAIEHLAESKKGLNALRHLLSWFEADGLALNPRD